LLAILAFLQNSGCSRPKYRLEIAEEQGRCNDTRLAIE